jgi:hypothetical protein
VGRGEEWRRWSWEGAGKVEPGGGAGGAGRLGARLSGLGRAAAAGRAGA